MEPYKINNWTVIQSLGCDKFYMKKVLARCSCGFEAERYLSGLKRSMGCQRCAIPKHGDANSPENKSWQKLRERCNNPKCKQYPRYGGRGIKVDPAWNDYTRFLSDMGRKPTPKHQIDRIDNDGPYSKDNCRWATPRDNCNNRHNSLWASYKGESYPLTVWAEKIGISYYTLRYRIKILEWPIERALNKQ